MTALEPKKDPKTSWVFLLLMGVSACFVCLQSIVPLTHISTEERLQASKNSFKQGTLSLPLKLQKTDKDRQASARQRKPDYHVVFSTSCSDQQNWESYVFFYHAFKVGQPGNVTRIASGCSAKEAKEQTDFFNRHIHPLSPTGSFHLHLTPDYGNVALADGHYYKYMNKPYGLRHWMEHVLRMNPETMQSDVSSAMEDGIVILMDPDMILLRPLLHDFSDMDHHLWVENDPATTVVRHGYPIAQQDGYLGNQWMYLDTEHIFGRPKDQHPPIPPAKDGALHYNTGPPYLATVRDMYKIAVKWTEFAPRVVEIHPELFAEMYGFIYSTVELNLPFTLIKSIVVSVTTTPIREGWKLIDNLKEEDACDPPASAILPIALHYCKRYGLGKWFFSKYRLKKNIMNCEKALLLPPPPDLAAQNLDYFVSPPRADGKDRDTYSEQEQRQAIGNQKQVKREAFMLCGLTKAVNDALIHLKQHGCGDEANFNATYTVYNDPSNY